MYENKMISLPTFLPRPSQRACFVILKDLTQMCVYSFIPVNQKNTEYGHTQTGATKQTGEWGR